MGEIGNDASVLLPESYQEYIDAQGDDWPETIFDGSDTGYFWNKWESTSDGGATFNKPIQSLIDWTTSGDAFHPLHPRMGGIGFGDFTYAPSGDGSVGVAQDIHYQRQGRSRMYKSYLGFLSLDKRILFKKANGEIVPPHIIITSYASQRLGTRWIRPLQLPTKP